MAADPREWTVPDPVRALLWWPPVAFLLGVLVPQAADGAIAVSGLVLALAGAVGGALRRRSGNGETVEEAPADLDAPLALPVPAERRAA